MILKWINFFVKILISGRGVDTSSLKTISFVDFGDVDRIPEDKYGDDDDQVQTNSIYHW